MGKPSKRKFSYAYTYSFIVILSFICAVILSLLASGLREKQKIAQELDKQRQMLIATKIINPEEGYFQIRSDNGFSYAKYQGNGVLAPSDQKYYPSDDEIIDVYKKRVIPFLVDDKGNTYSFEKAGIDKDHYLEEYETKGYYKQPYKLVYKILPNNASKDQKPIAYVIPIKGFGLWDVIYGYLALEPDGNTVIGISWYEQKETPGLGAVIADPSWQAQFSGKKIFLASSSNQQDLTRAPIGIQVIKGKVSQVFGTSPKAHSAVDGIAGATLTGNGVTAAYKDVLEAYRPFLIKLNKENQS